MNKSENDLVVKKNNKVFDARVEKHGVSSSAVRWDDQQTQYLRFFELVKTFDLSDQNKTVLDVGCGNGELLKFLNFLGFRGQYFGVDINQKLINQAKGQFGPERFTLTDIMVDTIDRKFDYVVMSGLFNTNVGQSMDWINDFTKKMFSLTKDTLSFNAVSTHVSYHDDEIFYIAPEEMLRFCIENLSPRVTLTHHNLPYNYTVIISKNSEWTSVNRKKNDGK